MAVVMRLRRMGAKKDPKFRIVVAESRYQRDGRFVEELGHYNPQPKEAELKINTERAAYWLSVGATPSDQVKSLLKLAGVTVPSKVNKPKPAKPKAAKGAVKKNAGARKRAEAKKARVAAKAARPKKPSKKPAGKKAAKK